MSPMIAQAALAVGLVIAFAYAPWVVGRILARTLRGDWDVCGGFLDTWGAGLVAVGVPVLVALVAWAFAGAIL